MCVLLFEVNIQIKQTVIKDRKVWPLFRSPNIRFIFDFNSRLPFTQHKRYSASVLGDCVMFRQSINIELWQRFSDTALGMIMFSYQFRKVVRSAISFIYSSSNRMYCALMEKVASPTLSLFSTFDFKYHKHNQFSLTGVSPNLGRHH